jgi:succinylarginine dihydrolase
VPGKRAGLDLAAGHAGWQRPDPAGQVVDVRQSMANGGGPACLRLRVVADPATVDPRFLLDEARADAMEAVIAQAWPEQIDPADIGSTSLAASIHSARTALLDLLGLAELA